MKESIHACEDDGLVPVASTKHATKAGVIGGVIAIGAVVGGGIAAGNAIEAGVGDINIRP